MDAITSHPFLHGALREECGVFGVFGHPEAAALTALGLHALQHRGQEAAGMVSYDGHQFFSERHIGLVGDNFTKVSVLNRLRGDRAIGHTRYSTTGGSVLRNVQPLFAEFVGGGFAISHNGNLTNALTLQRHLQKRGALFQSTSDSETIIHLIAMSEAGPITDRLVDAVMQIEGAYALACLTEKKMIGVRDPLGIRPLVLGKLDNAYILASETCAFDIIGAQFIRDVEPGEVVVITDQGIRSIKPFPKTRKQLGVFEYIYFSRPDSVVDGRNVYEVRKRFGAQLAIEDAAPADIVIPVPDSGTPAAIGYSQAAQVPFELGIIRNQYVGRTFIQPTDQVRHSGVKLKHNANRDVIAGKRVVLIDDSIVRGTTSLKIVQMVRDAGATEVHMRIASPPVMHPSFYGIDTPEQAKLIAAKMTVDELAKFIKVDSLAFLSVDGLYKALGEEKRDEEHPQFCDACFTGDYPTNLTDRDSAADTMRQLSLLAEPS
ncbi:MAG: amidophosphoribosyltransferase [Pseudomonadota bacterium]